MTRHFRKLDKRSTAKLTTKHGAICLVKALTKIKLSHVKNVLVSCRTFAYPKGATYGGYLERNGLLRCRASFGYCDGEEQAGVCLCYSRNRLFVGLKPWRKHRTSKSTKSSWDRYLRSRWAEDSTTMPGRFSNSHHRSGAIRPFRIFPYPTATRGDASVVNGCWTMTVQAVNAPATCHARMRPLWCI